MNLGFLALLVGTFAGVSGVLAARSSFLHGTHFVVVLCLSILLPFAGYLIFQGTGYSSWNWAPFAYGSLAPIVMSCLGLGAAVLVLFYRRGVALKGAFLIALASSVTFVPIVLFAHLFVACSMGDCI